MFAKCLCYKLQSFGMNSMSYATKVITLKSRTIHRAKTFATIPASTRVRNVSVEQQPFSDDYEAGFKTRISIYDSCKKKKVPLLLEQEKVVRWYTCGPTVYDDAHIGHGYCYVKFDIIRRILQNFFDLDVIYLLGITDIDDKIITKALQEKKNFQDVTQFYEHRFMKDMQALNVLTPSHVTRVTDFVPSIISFVQRIVEKQFAYVGSDGSVYFDVSKYDNYGVFKPVSDDPEQESPYKKRSCDFALWKASKPHEPSWDSPWGKGRPGWHIECSVMASHIFGKTLDIHSGGVDLIFPHHENELAQCAAFHGTNQWAKYWLHSGHVYMKDQKMSKSLQNTITIQDFLRSYSADEFRLFCLLSSLRNNINYTADSMDQAKAVYLKVHSFLGLCNAYVHGRVDMGCFDESDMAKSLSDCRQRVSNALSDNFDTYSAVSAVLQLVSKGNKCFQDCRKSEVRSPTSVASIQFFVENFFIRLGLRLAENSGQSYASSGSDEASLPDILDSVVAFRREVRSYALGEDLSQLNKEELRMWKLERLQLLKACDDLRNKLASYGISIQDHAGGSHWSRKPSLD